jgi:hypothetical protein
MSPSPLSRASSLASSRRENPTARFFSSRRAKIEKKKMTTTRTNAKSEEDEDDAQKRKNPDLYCAGGEEWEKEEEETEAQRRRQSARKKPDVLAPAGGWPQLEAAVRNGANCVYFGLELLNARARANNFTIEELPRVMNYLRERGVKGYVTMNVLIFDDEMSECESDDSARRWRGEVGETRGAEYGGARVDADVDYGRERSVVREGDWVREGRRWERIVN